MAGLALCGSALTGCSEDYLLGEEGNTVNTETEADVPKDMFVIVRSARGLCRLRAAVDGISNSIYRVQTLLYKDNALVETKTILDDTEGTKGWNGRIMEATYRKDLERGGTYTIVYLGNIPQREADRHRR